MQRQATLSDECSVLRQEKARSGIAGVLRLFQALLVVGTLSTLCAQTASTIVIGFPPRSGTGNCIPFGCPNQFGLTEFQQVYPSSSFPGAVTINQITFFNTQSLQGVPITPGSYQFSLSTT